MSDTTVRFRRPNRNVHWFFRWPGISCANDVRFRSPVSEKQARAYVRLLHNLIFEREPFYATFRSANFDYTLIVMHSDFDNNKEVMRREARALKSVFLGVQDGDTAENDLILMGDFNLSADDASWDSLRTIPTVRNLIPGTTRTTLKTTGALSNAFDNIWIVGEFSEPEYADTSEAHYYYNELYAGSSNPGKEARKYISDHVPVFSVFFTTKPDDD